MCMLLGGLFIAPIDWFPFHFYRLCSGTLHFFNITQQNDNASFDIICSIIVNLLLYVLIFLIVSRSKTEPPRPKNSLLEKSHKMNVSMATLRNSLSEAH